VARARAAARAPARVHFELPALLALAGVLDLWRLSQNGWANPFYSAAVRSMSSSWHDFVYASFDPSGVMTVDKPPLALWVQALSVRAFGFHPLSILVPQALIGIATVGLVYDLTRRRFGRAAGFAAGLVLALTPVTVAMSRHNNPDALLALCAVAALWCTVRALEQGSTRWLVLSGVFVGLGFETKLSAVLLVVPGIVVAWLWVAPRGRRAAVGQLLQAGAAAIAVGGAWPLLVALTPATDRPWIGSTADNSIWSLMSGYNGIDRLSSSVANHSGLAGGPTGTFRLVNPSLGGQAGWLLGLALAGLVAIAVASRLRRGDPRTGWVLLVGLSLAATAIVFSEASGIFHPYYLAAFAPFVAALAGAGAAQLVRSGPLAALGVAAAVVTEAVVIHNNPQRLGWLEPLLVIGGALLAALLLGVRHTGARAAIVAVLVAGLLVAPATWAVQTLGHPTSPSFPAGGPAGADAKGGTTKPAPKPARPGKRVLTAHQRAATQTRELQVALAYVRRHGGGTLGIKSQDQAAPAITASDAQVAGLGGYNGGQSDVTVPWLAGVVRSRQLRWVLMNGKSVVRPGHAVGAGTAMTAVAATCKPVRLSAFRRVGARSAALYDCRGRALALDRYALRLIPVSRAGGSLVP
jgi:4-amino-4-deoxy-L-arabinose transferase-like glycosyltransferase